MTGNTGPGSGRSHDDLARDLARDLGRDLARDLGLGPADPAVPRAIAAAHADALARAFRQEAERIARERTP